MKVSIITISYKNAVGLEKTIKSIQNQTYPEIEHIVIDGGSKDGTKEIIEQYSDMIAYWVSETDKGIYNAMNKGVDHATGEYCLFINSGDCLYSPTALADVMVEHPIADLAIANIITDDDIKSLYCPPEEVTCSYMLSTGLPHPSALIKTDLIKRLRYDESYNIISDWAFMFRALIHENCTYQHIDKLLSVFYSGGISGTQKEKELSERKDFIYKSMPKRVADELFDDYSSYFILVKNMKSREQSLIKFIIRTIQWFNRKHF